MFRTWIIRQHNTVWVRKLTDIVTSFWLGIIVLPKELFKVMLLYGISYLEKMRVWKCKQVIDFDQSTTTVKEERNKTLLDESDKLLWSICYIGTQLDLSQVTTLNKKSQSSTAKLNRTKKELWIVNFGEVWIVTDSFATVYKPFAKDF